MILRTRHFLRWLFTPVWFPWQKEARQLRPPADDAAADLSSTWSAAALRATVERLAAEPSAQLAYLEELMRDFDPLSSLDELALEFDEEYERVRPGSGPDEYTLPREAATALAELDAQLDAMSGEENARLWVPAALEWREWGEVRRLAENALSALDRDDEREAPGDRGPAV